MASGVNQSAFQSGGDDSSSDEGNESGALRSGKSSSVKSSKRRPGPQRTVSFSGRTLHAIVATLHGLMKVASLE